MSEYKEVGPKSAPEAFVKNCNPFYKPTKGGNKPISRGGAPLLPDTDPRQSSDILLEHK